MIVRALLVVATLSSPSYAQVVDGIADSTLIAPATTGAHAELGAGAGVSSSTGYGLLTVNAGVTLARPAPALDRRGLHSCPLTGNGCWWAFTGLAADDVDGLGASLRAELRHAPQLDDATRPSNASLATSLILGAQAWGSLAGWRANVRGDIQPTGSLRDPFWRSGRGILEGHTRIDIPAMWAIGTMETQLIAGVMHVELGSRTDYSSGVGRHAGFDRDLAILAMRLQSSRYVLDLMQIRLRDFGIEERTVGDTTYGTSAAVIDAELAGIDLEITRELTAHAHGGLTMQLPVAPFTRTGGSEHSVGQSAMAPAYWAELTHTTTTTALGLGGGSWTRLDPTAHAVDHGHLGAASIARTGSALSLRGELAVGKLRRIVIGDRAPDDIDPVGTRMWMGRASLAATLAVTRGLLLNATTWIERSDRDDPRFANETTELATRAGADVSAAWRFQRTRALRPRAERDAKAVEPIAARAAIRLRDVERHALRGAPQLISERRVDRSERPSSGAARRAAATSRSRARSESGGGRTHRATRRGLARAVALHRSLSSVATTPRSRSKAPTPPTASC